MAMEIWVGGHRVRWHQEGRGEETLAVLQGWGTSRKIYEAVGQALGGGMRVIYLDLPGFGESPEPEEAWSVEEYTDFFVEFVKAMGIERLSILGHSYGGRMALLLAAREQSLPFALDKVVLVGSAGLRRPLSLGAKCRVAMFRLAKKIALWKPIYALFGQEIDQWMASQGSADYRAASPLMRRSLVMAVSQDLAPLLPEIDREILLIWGDGDTATPLEDGRRMEALLPRAGLAVVPGAGHYVFLERPQVFIQILRSYFGL